MTKAVQNWRVMTRKRGYKGWDMGQTPMTKARAELAAMSLNEMHPAYEHRAVKLQAPR